MNKTENKENPYWILWNKCDQLQDSIGLLREEFRKHNVPEEGFLQLRLGVELIQKVKS